MKSYLSEGYLLRVNAEVCFMPFHQLWSYSCDFFFLVILLCIHRFPYLACILKEGGAMAVFQAGEWHYLTPTL